MGPYFGKTSKKNNCEFEGDKRGPLLRKVESPANNHKSLVPWLLAQVHNLIDSKSLCILVGANILRMKTPPVEDDQSIGFHVNEVK